MVVGLPEEEPGEEQPFHVAHGERVQGDAAAVVDLVEEQVEYAAPGAQGRGGHVHPEVEPDRLRHAAAQHPAQVPLQVLADDPYDEMGAAGADPAYVRGA